MILQTRCWQLVALTLSLILFAGCNSTGPVGPQGEPGPRGPAGAPGFSPHPSLFLVLSEDAVFVRTELDDGTTVPRRAYEKLIEVPADRWLVIRTLEIGSLDVDLLSLSGGEYTAMRTTWSLHKTTGNTPNISFVNDQEYAFPPGSSVVLRCWNGGPIPETVTRGVLITGYWVPVGEGAENE